MDSNLFFGLVLIVAFASFQLPSINRRVQNYSDQKEHREQWRALGVENKDIQHFVDLWGVAPDGITMLGTWMANLELTAKETSEWRQTGSDLAKVIAWRRYGFTPASALAWFEFTPSEAKQWRDGNFRPSEISEWRGSGFHNPADARLWSAKGLLQPVVAARWRGAGFSAVDAVAWTINGITAPHEAERWQRINVRADDYPEWAFTVPEIAVDWLSRGFDSERARTWISIGCVPSDALHWESHGVDAHVAHAWIEWTTPTRAMEWIELGFQDPQRARSWFDLGVDPKDAFVWSENSQIPPYLAANWIKGGWSPEGAQAWLDKGFVDHDVCQDWISAGFNPSSARPWAMEGLDARTATEWIVTGVAPGEVRLWVKHGVNSVRASEWWSAGFTDAVVVAPLDSVGCTPDEIDEWRSIGIGLDAILEERRYWTPQQCAEWFSTPGIDRAEARELSGITNPETALQYLSIGVSMAQLKEWVGRPAVASEGPLWITNGIVDPASAEAWQHNGFTPEHASEWSEVRCEPSIAKQLVELKCLSTQWPVLRQIMDTEHVGVERAIWRQSIDEIGLDRQEDIPVFSPKLGNATWDDLDKLLTYAERSGCERINIRHGYPRLSREMLTVMPAARLQRGAVRQLVWEFEDAGRVGATQSMVDTTVDHVTLRHCASLRAPRFGEDSP